MTIDELKAKCNCVSDKNGFCLVCGRNIRHSCICHLNFDESVRMLCSTEKSDLQELLSKHIFKLGQDNETQRIKRIIEDMPCCKKTRVETWHIDKEELLKTIDKGEIPKRDGNPKVNVRSDIRGSATNYG